MILHRHNRTAFTLIELLVVIAIIAVLLSIVTPALRKALQTAHSVVCRNHLKTLAMANHVYVAGPGTQRIHLVLQYPESKSALRREFNRTTAARGAAPVRCGCHGPCLQ